MKIPLAMAVIVLTACAGREVALKPPNLSPGPAPTRARAEEIARKYLYESLKDPDSLKQFALTRDPYPRDWQYDRWSTWYSGHVICFRYNAKNSYGGYEGVRPAGIVVRLDRGPDPLIIYVLEAHTISWC